MPKLYTAVLLLCVLFTSVPHFAVSQPFTNRGNDFWVGFPSTSGSSAIATMKIYMGAGAVGDSVKIAIAEGTANQWTRTYWVPANTVVESDALPSSGLQGAQMPLEGLYANKGIHITSRQTDIVAYAHVYGSASSGATLLLPSKIFGSENYVLTSRQSYSNTSYSAFHVVAANDSTWVEIKPSRPTLGGWIPGSGTGPNGGYVVKLNKGDAYQVLGAIVSGSEGYDLTGSSVISIPNDHGKKFPVAVFCGSTRTGIGCGTSVGGSGDLIIQQVFPYQTWGMRYLTAPFSTDASPSTPMTTVYRVYVKEPTTLVARNGAILTSLVNNSYYQFESNTPDHIYSDRPILVAQFMPSPSGCQPIYTGYGDVEMIYLAPLENAIPKTTIYRTTVETITTNYVTIIIPTAGLASLKIDGTSYASSANTISYPHPNRAGYSVVVKRWIAAKASGIIESNYAFTGITYGLGSVESYGYNLGVQFDSSNLESVKYNTIKGSLFLDANRNGIKDNGEGSFTAAKVETTKPGSFSISSMAPTGTFMHFTDTGSFTTKAILQSPYYTVVPAAVTRSFSTYFNVDSISFAVQPMAAIRDLSVGIIPIGTARPGFAMAYKIMYTNTGTDTADAVINLVKSSKVNYASATLAPAYTNNDTLRWNLAAIKPGQAGEITVNVSVKAPPAVVIGDTLRSVVSISSNIADITPANNTATLLQRVVGAYDPNDKVENHGGKILVSEVANGGYLQYTIRFQNTGTDVALNAYITDTLDDKLDWNSLVMTGSSHPYRLLINDGKYCKWVFDNINLVDSNHNEALSHGYISYTIKPKNTVINGDVITNSASIYFDHNLPVITNREQTTVVNAPLPVTLVSFTATRNGKENLLQWNTTQEINFSHYNIERSNNGREFNTLASVSGGAYSYHFADANFERVKNYYRLKIVNKDGGYEYSPVRTINNKGTIDVGVYPNPVKDKLQLRIESDLRTTAQLQVYTLTGKLVSTRHITLLKGTTSTSLTTTSLPAGSYIIKITTAEKETMAVQFDRQ